MGDGSAKKHSNKSSRDNQHMCIVYVHVHVVHLCACFSHQSVDTTTASVHVLFYSLI